MDYNISRNNNTDIDIAPWAAHEWQMQTWSPNSNSWFELIRVSFKPLDPMNVRVLQNIKKYKKLLVGSSSRWNKVPKRPTSSHLQTRDTYERLCQTQGSQVCNTRFLPFSNTAHLENEGIGNKITTILTLSRTVYIYFNVAEANENVAINI